MAQIHQSCTVWAMILLGLVLAWQEPYTKAAPDQTASQKPNIVFILVDNLGYGELGVYGGGILRGAPTPRIDKLASEGTRLLNFNVEAQCTPSRSALMTGRFSIRPGTYAVPLGGVADGLTLWEIPIAKLLSGQGYATQAGKLQSRGFPRLCGRSLVRGEVTKLEDAPSLAGQHERTPATIADSENRQLAHRSQRRA
jgi:Sulfatase